MGRLSSFWAFVLSPVPAALVSVILGIGTPRLVMFPVFLMLLWAVQLVFGIAIRWLAMRRGPMTLWRHFLAGCAMGALPCAVLLSYAVGAGRATPVAAVVFMALFTIMGGITGASYWMLARHRLRDADKRVLTAELRARFE